VEVGPDSPSCIEVGDVRARGIDNESLREELKNQVESKGGNAINISPIVEVVIHSDWIEMSGRGLFCQP